MSTFGEILHHSQLKVVVNAVTLRGKNGRWGGPDKVEMKDVVTQFAVVAPGIIGVKYALVGQDQWIPIVTTMPAADVRAYGKNIIGFDTIRMLLTPKDRDIIAIWLEEVMTQAPTGESFYIQEGWPTYDDRDGYAGTAYRRLPEAYHSVAAAHKALQKFARAAESSDASFDIIDSEGQVVRTREPTLYVQEPGDNIFGLNGLASGLINGRQKYHLRGDVWVGKTLRHADRRLVLERQDGSHDSAYFLYFDMRPGHAFISRVDAKTVARDTKYVEFKRGPAARVKVLRADLLTAIGAIS